MRPVSISDLGEFGLIHRLAGQLTQRAGVQLGIGDDAAVLDALAQPIVTVDALVEGVHFRRDWMTAEALGRKAMAVNVSDIAAMGARPVAAFIVLGVSKGESLDFIDGLYQGMEASAAQYEYTLAGGDTVRAVGPCLLSVTLIGEVLDRTRGPVLRSGAQAGDVVVVSGQLGDSAAGLQLLLNPEAEIQPGTRAYLLDKHLNPTPRLKEMAALLQAMPDAVTAAMDLSDGLAGDGGHLAARSEVRLEINIESLPISKQCLEAAALLATDAADWTLSGGEDYELLLTVRPYALQEVQRVVMDATGTALTPVGRCVQGPAGVTILEGDRPRVNRTGFTHF